MDRLIPLLKDLQLVVTLWKLNLRIIYYQNFNPSVGLAEELLSPQDAVPNENITELSEEIIIPPESIQSTSIIIDEHLR